MKHKIDQLDKKNQRYKLETVLDILMTSDYSKKMTKSLTIAHSQILKV